ncbi:hypothetical protein NPIL_680381 [Nephila pilipes]|uniref:Uncharacterized protein n=1 Tax=Nephila pilipes TaxID=299642 RepID=A0A8X6NKY6_NEPPI|nr:hypothetical protein NPIL_680381 [Nephila pilipes]
MRSSPKSGDLISGPSNVIHHRTVNDKSERESPSSLSFKIPTVIIDLSKPASSAEGWREGGEDSFTYSPSFTVNFVRVKWVKNVPERI